jgi:signal transduction histidine kinase
VRQGGGQINVGMSKPPQPDKDPSGRLLIGVLAVVMGAFVFASLFAQRTSAKVESLSDAIVSISAPSIERLASMRSVVFEAQLTLSEALREGAAAAPGRLATLDASLKALDEDVEGYLTLPILKDEQSYWRHIQGALVRFNDAIRRTGDLVRAGATADAQKEFTRAVEPSGRELIETALSAIEFHARSSRAFASEIRDARRRAIWIANLSSGICVAFGIAGLLLIRRQARRHRALLRAQSEFHEARANELEQFAGRVAHDIKNPMSSALLAAQLALRRAGEHGQKEALVRIVRALSRADAITTGLLDFARSGARPEPGARTDPREALEDLLRGLGPEAERERVEIQLDPVPPVLVACSQGVYLSLVGNLVRNAIKYMGQTERRRITLRVIDEGAAVRTEVIDTGPGIASENLPSLFNPYFRLGRDRAKDGLGLGLATVKKLAEGHHGQVGVTSKPGEGSTFWFVLLRAGSAWTSEGASGPVDESAGHRPEVHH